MATSKHIYLVMDAGSRVAALHGQARDESPPESVQALTSVRRGDVDDVADGHPSLPVKAMQDKLL
jgi:hypothetical protein